MIIIMSMMNSFIVTIMTMLMIAAGWLRDRRASLCMYVCIYIDICIYIYI